MGINWTTRREHESRQLKALPKPKRCKIRRKAGGRGFYHKGTVVKENEVIECDVGDAQTLVELGKAEIVRDQS